MHVIMMLFVLITSEAMNVIVSKVLLDLVHLLEVVPLAVVLQVAKIYWQMDVLTMMNVSLENTFV